MPTENLDNDLGLMTEKVTEKTVHPLAVELQDVALAHDFVAMLASAAAIERRAGRSSDRMALAADLAAFAGQGALPSLLAIETLASVQHPAADISLVDLLSHPSQLVRRHASWRLADRNPSERAYPELLELLTVGGIDTLHAHRTLRSWSTKDARTINPLAIARLNSATAPCVRARLVDLIGVLAGPGTISVLLRIASDPAETTSARVAAIGALSERSGAGIGSTLQNLAARDDEVGVHASLALAELTATSPQPLQRAYKCGLRIAQLVLARDLDGQLSRGGRGDVGGVASLLVSVGEALAGRPDVGHVHTIRLGNVGDALRELSSAATTAHTYATIAVGDSTRSANTSDDLWEQLPTIERGIRRVLRRSGRIDLLHLRMADAGTLAGAAVARAQGIPICFSPAPDPHNMIQARQSGNKLSHAAFVELATEAHVWFRARMVEQLARSADRLALFPRARQLQFLENTGSARSQHGQRAAVVAEGIDVDSIRQAWQKRSSKTNGGDVLDCVAARIPAERRHLPLLLSVGRLHPIKGMDRVVAAWAGDSGLHERCNLLIVGGELDHPSTTEQLVIDAIDRIAPHDTDTRAGLLMLGGKGRADVARLQVATVLGREGYWAGGGVYVDGACKEEFGLALIEALAAGLVVVAPAIGGPPTYVEHGDTGILVEPGDDLGAAIHDAFALVNRSGRARRASGMVEQRYSVDKMAAQLAALYQPTGARR